MTIDIIPTTEARNALPRTLTRFREQGLLAEPLVFGGHRKPEGVVLPFEMFERLLPAIEDIALAEQIRERLSRNDEPVEFDQFAADNGFDVDAYLASKSE